MRLGEKSLGWITLPLRSMLPTALKKALSLIPLVDSRSRTKHWPSSHQRRLCEKGGKWCRSMHHCAWGRFPSSEQVATCQGTYLSGHEFFLRGMPLDCFGVHDLQDRLMLLLSAWWQPIQSEEGPPPPLCPSGLDRTFHSVEHAEHGVG